MNALADDFFADAPPMTVDIRGAFGLRSRTEVPLRGPVIDYTAEVRDFTEQRGATGLMASVVEPEQATAEIEEAIAYRVPRTEYSPQATPLAQSDLVAEWHGQVTSLLRDSFIAELRGVAGINVGGSLEEAEIPMAEVRDDDVGLVRIGAFFRLCISYEQATTGTRRRFTEVIFRRLPAYRREELEEAASEAAQILRDIRVE